MLRIFYPQLGLILLLTLPFAWRLRWLYLGAVVALILVCPPALGRGQNGAGFTAITWNTRGCPIDLPEADVVALQEVETPATGYPHVYSEDPGMVILSKYPLTDRGVLQGGEVWDIPRVMWARVEKLGITVINVHPIPPYTYQDGGYNLVPELRDRQIEELRTQLIDPLLSRGEPFLLLGDCNVCEREAGYRTLTRGLQDGFRATSLGYQATWAPGRVSSHGWGLLRLDYHLASPGVTLLETTRLASSRGSDHFPVSGRYRARRGDGGRETGETR